MYGLHAQEPINKDSIQMDDSKYREDQFYLAVTYNLLENKPSNVKQTGFSSGFHFGVIRDFPINKRRNIGFGVGLGASINSYNHNIFMYKNNDGDVAYMNLRDVDLSFSKNRFNTYLLEFPLELRWRTSTASEYKFWRIYAGLKAGYVFSNSSRFRSNNGIVKHSNLDGFNDFQYGITLSVGYNTWNFHVYYSLIPILNNEAILAGERIEMSAVKFGLIFYIL